MNVTPTYSIWAKMIAEFEGLELEAYLDKGKVCTIGFGTTFRYDLARKVLPGDKISYGQAVAYLEHDMVDTVRLANVYLHTKLNSLQSTAICDYIYNRGIGNFLKTNLDELINANPFDTGIAGVILGTGLVDRLGHQLRGLARRRRCEATLYSQATLTFK